MPSKKLSTRSKTGTRKLSEVQKLRGKIRLALDQMMDEARQDLNETNQLSGPSRFYHSTEASTKLRIILEVSQNLERMNLIPKFYTQNKG